MTVPQYIRLSPAVNKKSRYARFYERLIAPLFIYDMILLDDVVEKFLAKIEEYNGFLQGTPSGL